MSSRTQPEEDFDELPAEDPLAFLYEDEDFSEEDPTSDNPAYGSLLGVGAGKGKKKPVIMLDEAEALKAAEVMEINAGQLMTNPDRSSRQVGFIGLDPLDAMQEEEEEGDLAESLQWDDEPADDEAEDVAASKHQMEEHEEQEPDLQEVNAQEPEALPEEEPFADEPAEPEHRASKKTALPAPEDRPDEPPTIEDYDWGTPNQSEPSPPAEAPTVRSWSASEAEPTGPEPQFEEVEWDVPPPAPADEPPHHTETVQDWQEAAPEPADPPMDAFAEEDTAHETDEPISTGLPVAEDDDEYALADEPEAEWQQAEAEPPLEEADAPPTSHWLDAGIEPPQGEPQYPFEPIWPDAGEAPVEEDSGLPPAGNWQAFAEQQARELEQAMAEEEDEAEDDTALSDAFAALSEPAPVALRMPEPPVIEEEVPRHHLRARVMRSQKPHTPASERVKSGLGRLHAAFMRVVWPQLKRLYRWALAQWEQFVSGRRRD